MQPKPTGAMVAGPRPTGRGERGVDSAMFMVQQPYPMAPVCAAGAAVAALRYHPRQPGNCRFPQAKDDGHFAMIIDCHGHYTTAPQSLTEFRDAQKAALKDPAQTPSRESLRISDDQIR